jgi:hypothetical protein
MATNELNVELRGPCPKTTVDVIDAVSMARRLSRTEMVNLILAEWAEGRVHEANLITRLSRSHSAATETLGKEGL